MPPQTLITDPLLLTVLASATSARDQSLQLLSTPTDTSSAKLLTARLALLRGLNRKAILAVRATKTSTSEARQEVDSLLLELQNLYYEQGHLLGEIRGCEEFEHVYRTLPMVSEEEFVEGRGGEVEGGGDLMVERIRDEGERRRELERVKGELVRRKEELVRETGAKKEELGKLDAEVEKWVGGLRGVGKVFEERGMGT